MGSATVPVPGWQEWSRILGTTRAGPTLPAGTVAVINGPADAVGSGRAGWATSTEQDLVAGGLAWSLGLAEGHRCR